MRKIGKRRLEMGEEAWDEHQRVRKNKGALRYQYNNATKVIKHRRNKKHKLIALCGGKCEICGYDKDVSTAFHFHHKDPSEKSFGIGSKLELKMETLIKETKKCRLLCSNCHAELHDEEYLKSLEERIMRHQQFTEEDVDRNSKNRNVAPTPIVCKNCECTFYDSKNSSKYRKFLES